MELWGRMKTNTPEGTERQKNANSLGPRRLDKVFFQQRTSAGRKKNRVVCARLGGRKKRQWSRVKLVRVAVF